MPTTEVEYTEVEIEVTQEDINEGMEGSCIDCPVARAVSRRIPGPRIWIGSIGPSLAINTTFVLLPEIAKQFIREFDIGMKKQPFKFNIDVPSHFMKV